MRIRTTKPEFWKSQDIANLSREDRLLFIGLWSYVDDNGVGIDDYRLVTADLFPLDDDQKEVREYVREGLATLERGLLITRYTLAGKSYLYINTWPRHQRVDKPNKPRYPRPEDTTPPPTRQNAKPDDHVARPSGDIRETPPTGTGEQRNRGTEEQRKEGTSGGEGHLSNARARETPPPPGTRPRCTRHRHLPDDDPGPNCIGCRDARIAEQDTASTAAAAGRAQRAEARAQVDDCPQCDDVGWLLGDDGTPLEPARRCQHRPLRSVG